MRQRTKYHVAITSQGYDQPEILQVAIKAKGDKENDGNFESAKNVTLINGKIQSVELDVSYL